MALDILIIDDEMDIRDLISDILKDEGFIARVADGSEEAFNQINIKLPNVIILDIWLQGSELDGLGILEVIKSQYPMIPVIIISGHGTIDTAVNAIKMGAYDYIEKPFTHDKLLITLKRACESVRLRRENIYLKSKVFDKSEMIGKTQVISKLKLDISKIAPTVGRVMIHGAVGTGKEMVARLIHKQSKRKEAPFVVFNPTFMNHHEINKELFGEDENSFPDRSNNGPINKQKKSLIECANYGTLYIDEITDLPPQTQNKLLKFLKEQIIYKNSQKTIVDVRIISSTTHDISDLTKQGLFSNDLYYRLNVIPLSVPSLSQRKDDIRILVEYFIYQLSRFSGIKKRSFSSEALAALDAYNWPGNIRQLRNVIEWTLIMNPPSLTNKDEKIQVDMLPREILTSNNNNINIGIINNDVNEQVVDMMSMSLRDAREVFERKYLSAQMNRFNNNISKTSTFVGMDRSALHRKLKILKIHFGSCVKNGKKTIEA
ncbi:MAG TPA: sigma-54 dependent transcriptional regulator [Candidatus Megaira endosymbiont of Hartmannula sinica]|nr:sigma-54 dependent transcriptional regulator [Candidatus Megaera endosymbiont of Hartmannula sinica]